MPDERRELDCRGAVRQLWDFLDAELDDAQMEAVQRHLDQCSRCLPHADFGRRFLDALHASRRRQLMPADARQHVMAALSEAGFGEPG